MEDWGSRASKDLGLKQQTERKQKHGDNVKGESKLENHCLHGQGFYLSFVYRVLVEPDTVFDPDFLHSEMTVTTSRLRLCIPDDEEEKASDTWNDIKRG